ncbi:tRNA (N6-threonylcarbamoyladenosine(37)-N6)-methyltransferase TrmO [Chitiniphilus shinanonensis]|uniref:tRNA (N6-threonylcarbamoyladenosine(37)-N6)-methyltransferase TrmO n=1 Tax=Chitiniphilus shinanonensis TaxID=553088 RepID=A0ABQ6BTS3_9NEIS|nr:tRNA (N6-threonylcarbamoyladenosine(37)-N6)-methyltransferase TrmO [Chitiniphilus shinanonensis]GLS04610.1 tRNA (N6-threonylcarbamoyladenosine(37)-N6)-methyltransferase TrmO [Chitiniphilus shinanonensis]
MSYRLDPLGHLATPFPDKFGIPRQPRLAPHARGVLRLLPPYDRPEAVRGLEAFSHVWLSFVFHQSADTWHPTVRPPRLGGNTRVGVFASRSPFRPNGLGLSLVELLAVDTRDGVVLTFGGVDLVDGTPIVDIKPYVPFAESVPEARGGFIDGTPATLAVSFAPEAAARLAALAGEHPALQALIEEVLAQDPRPAYADDPARVYGVRLHTFDIKWRCDGTRAHVLSLDDA